MNSRALVDLERALADLDRLHWGQAFMAELVAGLVLATPAREPRSLAVFLPAYLRDVEALRLATAAARQACAALSSGDGEE